MNDKLQKIYDSLKKVDFDLYINSLNDIIPENIYWYCEHNNHNIELIINNKLPLSNPQSFNDPFDSLSYTIDPQVRIHKTNFDYMMRQLFARSNDKVVNDLLDSILDKNILSTNIAYSDKYKLLKQELNRIIHKYTEIELISVRKSTPWLNRFYGFSNKSLTDFVSDSAVSCFSENKDDILMWAHYGRSCSGLCIEYSTKDIINRINKNINYFFIPIIYDQQMYTNSDYPISEKAMSYLWNLPQFMFKHPIWEYEKEWRIVTFNNKSNVIDSFEIKSITLGYNFSVYNNYISNNHDEKSQIDAYINMMNYARDNDICVQQFEPQTNIYKTILK